MPNDGLPPAPPPPPAPAPTPPAPPPAPVPPPPAPAPTPVAHRNPEDAVAELRAENAHHRIAARTAKEEAESLRQEVENVKAQTQAQIDAARAPLQQKVEKINQRILDTELRSSALQAGLADIDLLPLLDRSKVTVDDDGNVTGVAEAVADFKKRKPEYFTGGAGGNRGGQPDNTRRQSPPRNDPPPPADNPPKTNVRDMNPDEYRRHMAGLGRRLSSAR